VREAAVKRSDLINPRLEQKFGAEFFLIKTALISKTGLLFLLVLFFSLQNSMSTPLEQILALLDEEKEYERAILPRYLEVSKREMELFPSLFQPTMQTQQLATTVSPTASAVAAPSVRGFTKMSHMMQSLQQLSGGAVQQSSATRAYPEISGDPALFRFPLIPAESPWDAAKAVREDEPIHSWLGFLTFRSALLELATRLSFEESTTRFQGTTGSLLQ